MFIWWRSDLARISPDARTVIASAEEVFVSAVSAWEAAIKAGLGRLTLNEPFIDGVLRSGFIQLPVSFDHAAGADALPRHHGDPFDRMLVLQARAEGLTLVTADRKLAPYDVALLWSDGTGGNG